MITSIKNLIKFIGERINNSNLPSLNGGTYALIGSITFFSIPLTFEQVFNTQIKLDDSISSNALIVPPLFNARCNSDAPQFGSGISAEKLELQLVANLGHEYDNSKILSNWRSHRNPALVNQYEPERVLELNWDKDVKFDIVAKIDLCVKRGKNGKRKIITPSPEKPLYLFVMWTQLENKIPRKILSFSICPTSNNGTDCEKGNEKGERFHSNDYSDYYKFPLYVVKEIVDEGPWLAEFYYSKEVNILSSSKSGVSPIVDLLPITSVRFNINRS